MKRLCDKVAIVTGATSGIGLACVRTFASEGAKVIMCGRNMEAGQRLAESINMEMERCCVHYMYHEAEKEASAENIISETVKIEGKVDILFNNAGVMLPSVEIERLSAEDWNKTFSVNVNGYFFMCKHAKMLLAQNNGVIINNASIAGLHNYVIGRSYAYSASKAAIIQFSRQMAKNYGEDKIRVNCICPGIIETKMLGDRDREQYAKRIPLGYVGSPNDVAKVVLFLASDESSYLTGTVIPVDGGASI